MAKIVLNRSYCFGGFSLSKEAMELYNKLANTNYENSYELEEFKFNSAKAFRTDKTLIEVIETLGEEAAGGKGTKLEVIEISDNADFIILEKDEGFELLVWSESKIHVI